MRREGGIDRGDNLGAIVWPTMIGWEGPEWPWLNQSMRRNRTEGFPSPFATEMVPLRSLVEARKPHTRESPMIRDAPIKRSRHKEVLYRTPTVPPGHCSELMKMPLGLSMDLCLRSSSVGSMPCRRVCHWPITAHAMTPEGVSVMQPSMMHSRRDNLEFPSRRMHRRTKYNPKVPRLEILTVMM